MHIKHETLYYYWNLRCIITRENLTLIPNNTWRVYRVNASNEERLVHPNHMVYRKMEMLVNQMLDAEAGVPIKTVKSFLSKVPSVFTGQDLIGWIMKNLEMTDLCKLPQIFCIENQKNQFQRMPFIWLIWSRHTVIFSKLTIMC